MRAQLKATAQRWKNTAMRSTKRHRLQLARLKRSQRRVSKLEAELTALKSLTSPVSVKNHTYPAQLIALAVFMVVHGGSSLRCAAKTVGFVAQLLGWPYRKPSHTTIRRWVLRCGLWQLKYSTDKVGNYVAILDESIQIGREKLLLLLGVKLQEDRSIAAPLTSHDVEVLGLEVQQSWTGDNITDFMHRQLDRLPLMKLSYIISDSGANLRKAFRIIGVDQVGDCSHIMMNAVKKLLQNNKVLSQLATKIGQRRSQLMQTSEGYLLPGALRDKDRFLRIFTIVKWIERIDAYWSKLPQSSRNKLGFIEQARPLIKCMAQLKELIEITSAVLKYAGLSSISEHKWEQRILDYREKYNLTAEGLAFIEMIRKYFKGHVDLVAQHGRLICCSDIIESTFGRYKNKGGTPVISADVLSISLYNKDITIEMVTKALTGVPYKEVHQWEQHYTCDNRYSIVRRMNRELKSIA